MAVNKLFFERLNRLLTLAGMSKRYHERAITFGQLFRQSYHTSYAIVSGALMPRRDLLVRIARELEVDESWLLGGERCVLAECESQ